MKSGDWPPETSVILLFNTETIEFGTTLGRWITSNDGHPQNRDDQEDGFIFDIAPHVRWRSMSGEFLLPEQVRLLLTIDCRGRRTWWRHKR